MRWFVPVGFFLVLIVMICGCIQTPAGSPVTPAPTDGIGMVTPTVTPVPPHPSMEVNVSARRTAGSVVIRVEGGRDAALLSSLNVRITNFDGTVIQRAIPRPIPGEPYSIEYYHTANAATVNIVGTFSDGFQRTLLLTSV